MQSGRRWAAVQGVRDLWPSKEKPLGGGRGRPCQWDTNLPRLPHLRCHCRSCSCASPGSAAGHRPGCFLSSSFWVIDTGKEAQVSPPWAPGRGGGEAWLGLGRSLELPWMKNGGCRLRGAPLLWLPCLGVQACAGHVRVRVRRTGVDFRGLRSLCDLGYVALYCLQLLFS